MLVVKNIIFFIMPFQMLAYIPYIIDYIELLYLWPQEYNQSDFSIDHLVRSICRVLACVVGRRCLLWPVHSLRKTVLAYDCFTLYSKAKFACYSRYLLTSYFYIPVPYDEKDIFLVLVLSLVDLHRTIQLQLLQHYWSEHRLGLLWYWMVCLGNKLRSFCHFWDCI